MDGHGRIEGMRNWKGASAEWITVGWTDCNCDKGFKSGIVLDPFMGSGTTGLVAKQLGLRWIGIELKPEYCEMAIKRIGEGSIEQFTNETKITEITNITKMTEQPESVCPKCGSRLYVGKQYAYCTKIGCDYIK
jgi:hypothetical protein